MALVRKWDGIGVSDGTLGSKAGSGDAAFDASNASPSVAGETITKAANAQHRWSWTGLDLGAIAIRFYFVQRSAPSGTSPMMQARDSGGLIFGLSINSGNQLTLRNYSNSGVSTSPAVTIGRLYRVDLWKASGNSTIQFRVHDVAAGTDIHTGSGSGGRSSNVTIVEFGQNSSTNSGGYRYSHMRVEDTNSRIGAYVAESGDFDVAHTIYGSTSSSSSHTVPLPATAYDDLLIGFLRSGTSVAPSVPGGWSSLGGDLTVGERIVWRQATGSEGGSAAVTVTGGAHLAAIVYRVRSSRSIKGVFTETDTRDPDSLTTSPDWSGERNLWIYGLTWVNSDASAAVSPTQVNTLMQASSGSASGRPAVAVGERRWTGDTLDIGSPGSVTGTLSTSRACAIVLKFDSPGEPPVEDNLEWFIWDGVTLESVDALGALEVA